MALSVLVEKYGKYLPITEKTPQLTLGEGDTPLIQVPSLEMLLDTRLSHKLHKLIERNLRIFVKYEHENHSTASFKDRGMVIAVMKAVEEGYSMLLCASTGSTGASAAAYGAAAGIPVLVIVPKSVPIGKLAQIRMYGADTMIANGNFDYALKVAREIADKNPTIKLVNSVNEYRIEGQKTAAFEICDTLGSLSGKEAEAPDFHFLPVGNAGNITAYWKGYTEYFNDGKIDKRPKMMGYQASGAAPIVKGRVIENKDLRTDASAIRIGNPASWKRALTARDESGGLIDKVSDRQMYEAQFFLSAKSGRSIYVELASAASVAGIFKYDLQNPFPENSTIVAVVTGSGIKDPKSAGKNPFKKEVIRLHNGTDASAIANKIITSYNSR